MNLLEHVQKNAFLNFLQLLKLKKISCHYFFSFLTSGLRYDHFFILKLRQGASSARFVCRSVSLLAWVGGSHQIHNSLPNITQAPTVANLSINWYEVWQQFCPKLWLTHLPRWPFLAYRTLRVTYWHLGQTPVLKAPKSPERLKY